MSELATRAPTAVLLPPAPAMATLDEGARNLALLVYGLYLGSFFMPPLILGGLVLAYANRQGAPAWLQSHFSFQIRTVCSTSATWRSRSCSARC